MARKSKATPKPKPKAKPKAKARSASAPRAKRAGGKVADNRDTLADYLRTMYEIRVFEETVFDLLGQDIIKGASHLCAGQEATCVGSIAALDQKDVIASTHRGHGHCGAMGVKHAGDEQQRQDHWNKMMAELMGKSTGYCKGRGGSMHIADVEKGNLGATGIVGGNIPVGTGAALAEKLKGTGAVVLCYFGDGASNTGSFHESMNMAATWDLPIVYVVENNLYGMSVPFCGSDVPGAQRATNLEDVSERAVGYRMMNQVVDGQDLLAVRDVVSQAVDHARQGNGPVMVEAKTYRYFGHSRSDPRAYRTKYEEKFWRDRDPIKLFRARLQTEAGFSAKELDAIEAQAQQTIKASVEFSMASPDPNPDELLDDVYVPIVNAPADVEAEKARREHIRTIENEVRAIAAAKSMKPKELVAHVEQTYPDVEVHTIGEAVSSAQAEEMQRDPAVFVMGEDVALYGGAYKATKGLLEKFGGERVRDTAISEAAIAGAAAGAAMRGMRPVAEIMYVDFITISTDQLVHNAGYNRYMFGGKTRVSMVLRTEGGVGRSIAAHHSESLEAWIMHVPGLYLVMPSTPYDAKGLLKSAIRDDNPIVFIEHKATYSQVGPVPKEEYTIPLGVADVKRPGKDVTIIAYSRLLIESLKAADVLAGEGIEAEVVDPRTLKPLDVKTLAESVAKTGRLVCISEGFTPCGMAHELAMQVMNYDFGNGRRGWDYLDAQPVCMSAAEVPPPMSGVLEKASVPNAEDIADAVRNVLKM